MAQAKRTTLLAGEREGGEQLQRFDLVRWFSLVALLAGTAVTVSAAFSLSNFLTSRMVLQEANLTAGFVRSIIAAENAERFFAAATGDGSSGIDADTTMVFEHLAEMPDVIRTNVFAADGRVLWSSDPLLIGKRFAENEELKEALRAEVVVHSGLVDRQKLSKPEHRNLNLRYERFVESYTPIFAAGTNNVIGVVELYRIPEQLFGAIHDGKTLIWSGAVLTAVFLFVAFSGIVAKAQKVIERQHEQLVEQQGLAVVGEMGSAVAHGLRNPLASIRSSAEVALGSNLPDDARECANDIISQVDRLEGWIRRLLTYAKPAQATLGPVAIGEVVAECAEDYRRELERRNIQLVLSVDRDLPSVRGEAGILGQLINSLIANSSEAIHGGGKIEIRALRQGEGVAVEVIDDGPGLPEGDVAKVFTPFYTTKQKGLGLGLPLVKRVIERFGGEVTIANKQPHGVSVRLFLQTHLQEAQS
jgi:signal transduction histidine kinase